MIVLASASPRRRELLKLITPDFEADQSGADENTTKTNPAEFVLEIAQKKAQDVAKRRPNDTVIGADTVVYVSGQILGKPENKADARRMVALMQGNTHEVYTGVCVIEGGCVKTACEVTRVTFAPMTDDEIDAYVNSADIYDKAGAYAIQGEAAKYIERIDGCFYNVMGLPVRRLFTMLIDENK